MGALAGKGSYHLGVKDNGFLPSILTIICIFQYCVYLATGLTRYVVPSSNVGAGKNLCDGIGIF